MENITDRPFCNLDLVLTSPATPQSSSSARLYIRSTSAGSGLLCGPQPSPIPTCALHALLRVSDSRAACADKPVDPKPPPVRRKVALSRSQRNTDRFGAGEPCAIDGSGFAHSSPSRSGIVAMNSRNVIANWMTNDMKVTTALLIRSRSAPGDVSDNAYQPRDGTSTADPSIVTIRNGFPAPTKAARNVFPAANRTNSPLGGVRLHADPQSRQGRGQTPRSDRCQCRRSRSRSVNRREVITEGVKGAARSTDRNEQHHRVHRKSRSD